MNELLGILVASVLMLLPAAGILLAALHGPFRNRWWRGETALGFAFTVGGICFLAGFVGPIIVTPDANQGPLLGIFITGPAGLALGLVWGLLRAARRRREA
jgi:hypothetical protein